MNVITLCEMCRVAAPIVVDSHSGFIGQLSASTAADPDAEGRHSFGYLQAALEAIGLVDYGLVLFRGFVEAHGGHGAFTSVSSEPDDLVRAMEWADEAAPGSDDEDDTPPKGWVWGSFELRCNTCKKRRRCFALSVFEDRDARSISPAQVDMFAEVLPLLSRNFHQDQPLELNALAKIGRFLLKHRDHELGSRIIRDE